MKNLKKALIAGTCSVLLVAGSVAGTMAYLTDTETVNNTFTVGNVSIVLDELDVDNSTPGDNDRDKGNKYHLMPGHSYVKDPTIHVDAGSEDSWLFVTVTNGLQDIEATGETTIANQMAENGWSLVEGTKDVYAYKNIAHAGENIVVFDGFKISGTAKAAWDTNAGSF